MRHRDFIQNIIITLLAVSAVLLFSRTQFFQLGAAVGSGTLRRLTVSSSETPSSATVSDSLSAPVRTAVTGEYGRYGSVSLTTGSDDFTPIKTLLREVLGSARNRTESNQAAFQAALGKTSVYCDFLSSLPVPYLAELMGISVESTLSVRSLTVAEQDGQVVLFLWDGESRYYRCATAVQSSGLTEVLNHFELGVSTFAFEETAPYSAQLAPWSLFPDPLPELPQLSAADSTLSSDTLLTALGFNPHTNSRYTDSMGAEVIVEGDRVIRVSPSGTVSYTSGGEAALMVDAAGAVPTLSEAAVGAQTLLDTLSSAGEARLYLLSARQSGSETTLTFGYQLGGVPIRFSDGSAAAEVTLSGRAISALTLQLRQYSADGTTSLLLPLQQAMAIAAGQPGVELSIGYADNGASSLSASWLAD